MPASESCCKPCQVCGYPTSWRDGGEVVCPLCVAYGLKGGLVDCKTCHVSLKPIGETLRGIQLVCCPSCGDVRADLPGVKLTRGRAEAARRVHNPKVAGSSPVPATKKTTVVIVNPGRNPRKIKLPLTKI